MNREDRRVVNAIRKRVEKQNRKILDKYKTRVRELEEGGAVDWSLFNMVMERIDFRNCKNSMETLHKFYSSIWRFMARIIRENYNLRALAAKHFYDEEGAIRVDLSETDQEILNEICGGEGDPLEVSRKAHNEVKEADKRRANLSRKGIKIADKPKIITP